MSRVRNLQVIKYEKWKKENFYDEDISTIFYINFIGG